MVFPADTVANVFGCEEVIFTFFKNASVGATKIFHALGNNKDAFAAMESAGKTLALILAGWWTWQTYVRKRVRFPSAKVEHVINHWEDDEYKFLRVTLRMTNTGNVMIPIAEGCTWVQQVTPLPDTLRREARAGRDPVQPATTEFGWPLIQERQLCDGQTYEIEPGEAEEFHFDFIIPKRVRRVLIYSHVKNLKKRGWFSVKEIGWNLSTVCDIRNTRKGILRWLSENV